MSPPRVSKKVQARIKAGLRKYLPILHMARDRDINESDTVVILTDFLHEVLGFAKYREITTEFSIRGTYCDLAVKLDGSLRYLLEAKAIGVTLKEQHLRQAINYAAHHGVEWVVLSNGVQWFVYRMRFEQPIQYDRVVSIDLLAKECSEKELIDLFFLISREGMSKSAIEGYQVAQAACNPFLVGAVLMSDPVLAVLRRELRRISPGVKIDVDDLRSVVAEDVVKRDIVDSDEARLAGKQARKNTGRSRKKLRKVSTEDAERLVVPSAGDRPLPVDVDNKPAGAVPRAERPLA